MASNPPIQTGSGAQSLYLDQLMTEFQLSFVQSNEQFIADKVSPKIPVKKRTGQYVIWDTGQDYAVDLNARRRRGSRASLLDPIKRNGLYSCTTYGKAAFIDDQEINDGGDLIDIKTRQTMALGRFFLRLREYRVAQAATVLSSNPAIPTSTSAGGGNITNNGAPTYQWDDYLVNDYASNGNWTTGNINPYESSTNPSGYQSNPFLDLQNWQSTVMRATGFQPNHFVIPRQHAIVLRGHPLFVSRFKNWTSTVSSWDLPDQILGMKPIVAGGYMNTANRNINDTFTLSSIWGNNVVLYYVEDDQHLGLGVETMTSYKSFDLVAERQVFSWYEPGEHGWYVEYQETIQESVTAQLTTYVGTGVLHSP